MTAHPAYVGQVNTVRACATASATRTKSMISKLAHEAINAADLLGVDCTLGVECSYEEVQELAKELQDNPVLANPMLRGFAWDPQPNVPFVLVFCPEEGIAVTIYVVIPQ